MKNRMFYLLLIVTTVTLFALSNCKKKTEEQVTPADTTKTLATITTNSISAISQSSASCGGNISSDGNAAVTARGVCWSISQSPTILDSKSSNGTGIGAFTSSITGLTANTTYYVRAYATNSVGTAYGNQQTFTTTNTAAGTVTDFDGNVYNTITIGTQVWMKENLKVLHYRNGNPITNVTDNTAWFNLSTEAYCLYDNLAANGQDYGVLYNFFAVTDTRNICPVGWHVPTDAEWTILTDYLGGLTVAGDKLREVGTAHWTSPNTGATNSSGFTGLPGGYRYSSGTFGTIHDRGLWWTATQQNSVNAAYRYVGFDFASVVASSANLKAGYSLRLVKD